MSFAVEMLVVIVDPFLSAMHIDRRDDDFLDRLNHKGTTSVMFFMVFVQTFYQIFLSQVIHCWTPSEFPGSWVEYTNSYCWTKNTYYIPPHQLNIPAVGEDRRLVVYYQWVPYILCYLGIVAYLPGLVWYAGSSTTGLSVEDMVHSIRRVKVSAPPAELHRHTKGIASHIDRALRLSHTARADNHITERFVKRCRCRCTILDGCVMTCIWIITKLLYIGSSAAQIYSIYRFLGYEYLLYGIRCISDIYHYGGSRMELTMFPRVTMCDFEVRTIARHIPYTVQCNLPINIFNAKIFLIVWYWLAIVAILNILVFVPQIFTFLPRHRYTYFKEELMSLDVYDSAVDRPMLKSFVKDYLRVDGYLTMKYLAYNANEMVSAGVIKELWKIYKSRKSETLSHAPSPCTPTRKRHTLHAATNNDKHSY